MSHKLKRRTIIASLVVLIPTFLLFAILKLPQFQTSIARWIAGYLSFEWKTEVFVKSFYFDWGLDMHLENVVIFDQHQDTLVAIQDLSISSYQWSFEQGWQIASLHLDHPYFYGAQAADSTWNFDFLVDYYRKPVKDSTKSQLKIRLDNVQVDSGVFVWNALGDKVPYGMFNPNQIEIKYLTGQFQDIMWTKDQWQFRIFDLSGIDHCGLQLNACSAMISGKENQILFDDCRINTPRNDISGTVNLTWDKDVKSFADDVEWKAELTGYPLNLSELKFFYAPAQNWVNEAQVQLNFTGNLNDLNVGLADIRMGMMSHMVMQGSVQHLLDSVDIALDVDIKQMLTQAQDIREFAKWTGDDIKLPGNIDNLGLIAYDGHVHGARDRWRLYGELTTDLGLLQGDVEIDVGDQQGFIGYVQAEHFSIGRYYNSADLEYISGDLNIEGHGFELNNLEMVVDGALSEFRYKEYTFSEISINGDLSNRFFLGDLSMKDPNAKLDFVGQCDFSKKLPSVTCQLNVEHFNFKAIGAFPNLPYSAISGEASMDFHGWNWSDLEGELELKNVMYCANEKDYVLDYLELIVDRSDELKISLNSDIAIGEINGDISIKNLPAAFTNIVSHVLPQYDWEIAPHTPQKFDLAFDILDFSQVSEAFVQDLGISQNARIKLSVDESADFFEGLFTADTMAYKGSSFYGLVCDFQKPDEFVYATIQTDSVKSGGVQWDQLSIDARSEGDLIYTDWVWGNDSTIHAGDFGGQWSFDDDKIVFEFYRGDFRVKKEKWKVDYGATILYEDGIIWFKGMEIRNNWQHIALHGGLASDHSTPLIASFTNVNFDILNAFLPKDTQFQGVLDGNVSCVSVLDEPDFSGDISLSDFGINKVIYGDVCLKSQWVDYLRAVELEGSIENNEKKTLKFQGMYLPFDTLSPLDVDVDFDDMDLAFIGSFVNPEIIVLKGSMDGHIKVTGQLEEPQLHGYGNVAEGLLEVDYLKTKYKIADRIWIEPDRFIFDEVEFTDENNNKGLLTGNIGHKAFQEWSFDLLMDMEKQPIKVLNTTADDNSDYYGKGFATGYFKLKGDMDKLDLEVALKTAAGTKLILPMNTSEDVEMGQFIRFVQKSNSINKKEDKLDLSGVNLNIQIDVTPDAELAIIFDEAVGDVMRGRGTGHISMGISKLSTFDMYGQIEIASGNYLFTLKNLINKDFTVQPGGTISWYGNPYNAELKLAAVYKVNASLSDVLTDANSNGQRVPVDLIMNLSGKMMNPSVDFNIQLPTVDPMTKSRFESVVSNEQERNRQAFALLVLRQFVSPPNIVRTETNFGVVANSTELLSSQISNWLSQISDDFNLGFNYRSGDQISNDEIALALSTQLFNNRVQLSGNFGVSRGNATNQQPSNYIGDVKVEYILTKEGKLKLMAYNESNNYRNITTQQSPYTQGIGLVYQQDFDVMQDLIDSWFKRTKKNPN
jgi:hypothetical protein